MAAVAADRLMKAFEFVVRRVVIKRFSLREFFPVLGGRRVALSTFEPFFFSKFVLVNIFMAVVAACRRIQIRPALCFGLGLKMLTHGFVAIVALHFDVLAEQIKSGIGVIEIFEPVFRGK